MGLGSNTLAAYMTRALAEIKRLGGRMGARETTFMGLSGMGDLIPHLHRPPEQEQDIRHRGWRRAASRRPDSVTQGRGRRILHDCGRTEAFARVGVEMPITDELHRVLYAGKDIRTAFEDIRKRDTKDEDA